MGWENCHLSSFTIDQEEYSISDPYGGIFESSLDSSSNNSDKVKLKNLVLKSKGKFYYTYDFGDNWEHTITVEKIFEGNEEIKVPFCIDGKRACPPEDCGSVPGYEEILEALKNRKKKKYAELLEWLGDEYDPEQFDIEEINTILQPRKKKEKRIKEGKSRGKK
jgi:hypothetical protein